MKKLISCSFAVAALMPLLSVKAKADAIYQMKDSASFYTTLGKEEQDSRRYANAWRYYEKAAQFDSRNADVQLSIAEVCLKMNRMAPAIKALEAAGAIRPTDYNTQWKLAQIYYNYGQYDKVITMVPALRGKVADSKGWAYMLGKAYHSKQNYAKATEYLQQSLKDEPNNGEAYYLLGRMFIQMQNYKQAVPYYKKALSIDSTSQTSRIYELALVLATVGQYDESIANFQKALDKGYKARDDFYMNMAYTMADAHKTDEAVKMMKDMLARRPQDIGLINGLADVCYHSGRYKEAIGYWDRLLTYDDKNARALYQIGLAYIKMGKETDGQQLCDKAISMDPALAVLKHAKQMAF
jgi:tetratricopeptide (TPR) repeat protein